MFAGPQVPGFCGDYLTQKSGDSDTQLIFLGKLSDSSVIDLIVKPSNSSDILETYLHLKWSKNTF